MAESKGTSSVDLISIHLIILPVYVMDNYGDSGLAEIQEQNPKI
jgi:hypothetical protein